MRRGAGAVLIAEEMLGRGRPRRRAGAGAGTRNRPGRTCRCWCCRGGGADSLEVGDAIAMLGNVIVLERPLRVAALLSTRAHRAARAHAPVRDRRATCASSNTRATPRPPRRGARTSSWRCSRTSCAIRWRRSATRCTCWTPTTPTRQRRQHAAHDDAAAGRAHGAPGRRSAGRLASLARHDRRCTASRSTCARRCARAIDLSHPLLEARRLRRCRSRLPDAAAADRRATRCGSPRCSATCSTTPPSTAAPAATSRSRRSARAKTAVVAYRGRRHGHRARPAAVRVRTVRAGRPSAATVRRRASASAWRWCATWCDLHGGNVSAESEGDGPRFALHRHPAPDPGHDR